jgi:lipopolysaccharide/colanic/teichoic acid biosynthesis glycosyltransferase
MCDLFSSSAVALAPAERLVSPRSGSTYAFFKRSLDIAVSAVVLLLCSPVLLVVALVIKLDSAGPVFFLQHRVGWRGVSFRMIKLRSMRTDAELARLALGEANGNGLVFKLQADPRVTRVGRWLRRTSLDELPQFINVLLGQMSLVGPRPLPERDVSDADILPPGVSREAVTQWLAARHTVRPGISGLWQVKGRSLLTLADWIRYDLEYVGEQSFLLDLRILALTPFAVFSGRGAM